MSTNNLPLPDVAPWFINSPETIIVGDTISSDGRFVLYTLANQILQSSSLSSTTASTTTIKSGVMRKTTTTTTTSGTKNTNDNTVPVSSRRKKVLWLGCSSTTEEQIALGLRKIGCTDQSLSQYISTTRQSQQQQSHEIDFNSSLVIRSIPSLINNMLLTNASTGSYFNEEEFLKKYVYKFVKQWLQQSNNTATLSEDNVTLWIIIDDVSALANLFNDRLVYMLIHSICSISTNNFGLLIRHSIDNDYTNASTPNSNIGYDWFGSGGYYDSNNNDSRRSTIDNNRYGIPWERTLIEFASLLIDVIPLSTGISREVHGRLLFTRPYDIVTNSTVTTTCTTNSNKNANDVNDIGTGTGSTTCTTRTFFYNYCLTDNKVTTIRIS